MSLRTEYFALSRDISYEINIPTDGTKNKNISRSNGEEKLCHPQSLASVQSAYLKFRKDSSVDRTTLSAIVLLFLVYPNVSKLVLQFLQCDALGTDMEVLANGDVVYTDIGTLILPYCLAILPSSLLTSAVSFLPSFLSILP
jgi:hypothetical protein